MLLYNLIIAGFYDSRNGVDRETLSYDIPSVVGNRCARL